ncbi:MAG: retropepsin-like aspartic protease family protein [Hyphomicrobium sp.]
MALSSGTRSLISEAMSWGAVALIGALAIANYDTLKAVAAQTMGLPTAAEMAAANEAAAEAAEPPQAASGTVELKAGRNGHFHTDAEINGRTVEVLVDTGATMVALTYEDAERAGIRPQPADFTQGVSTANGIARVAPVVLDRVSIGDITVRGVRAVVSERGRLSTTLLGMTFLSRLERVDMRSGVLVLED